MSQQPLTSQFIETICKTYRASDPVFTELLVEQKDLKRFFAMFRAVMEVEGDESSAQLVDTITRLIAYFDKTTGIIAAHQSVGRMVAAITSEHEE